MSLTAERDLIARAKRERAGIRTACEQALTSLPARRQAWLAGELAKIKPVLIQKKGTRVPCEPEFRLTRTERKALAGGMLDEEGPALPALLDGLLRLLLTSSAVSP